MHSLRVSAAYTAKPLAGVRRHVGVAPTLAATAHSATGGLDTAAGHDAPAVRQQHDVEKNGGIEGRPAFDIIPEANVKAGQVDLVIDRACSKPPGCCWSKSTGSSFRPVWTDLNRGIRNAIPIDPDGPNYRPQQQAPGVFLQPQRSS